MQPASRRPGALQRCATRQAFGRETCVILVVQPSSDRILADSSRLTAGHPLGHLEVAAGHIDVGGGVSRTSYDGTSVPISISAHPTVVVQLLPWTRRNASMSVSSGEPRRRAQTPDLNVQLETAQAKGHLIKTPCQNQHRCGTNHRLIPREVQNVSRFRHSTRE
ncbi:hypothetical protein PtB15_1B264 [Puccinia triticina]|nr:hypothetical protein PtB15_1B264 [Puccinia triticina]